MKSIIYIAGYGRSGSTLLERILASNDDIVATGESCNIFRVVSTNERCSCGQTLEICSQWKSFHSNFAHELENYEKSRRRHESNWGFLFRNASHTTQLAKHFEFLLLETGKHVIDSSKTTGRSSFRPFLLAKKHDVRMIHLVKDGRGCLASNLKGSNQKLGRNEATASYRFAFVKTLFTWAGANIWAELFRLFNPGKYLRVRYEDLSQEPLKTIKSMGEFLQIDLSKSAGILSQNLDIPLAHQVAGNRMSSQLGIKLIKKPGSMPNRSGKYLAFSIFNFPLMWRYGYLSRNMTTDANETID